MDIWAENQGTTPNANNNSSINRRYTAIIHPTLINWSIQDSNLLNFLSFKKLPDVLNWTWGPLCVLGFCCRQCSFFTSKVIMVDCSWLFWVFEQRPQTYRFLSFQIEQIKIQFCLVKITVFCHFLWPPWFWILS